MSLLSPLSLPTIPVQHRLKGEASQIKSSPRRLTDQLVKQWETSFDLLWTESNGITPAMRIAELGKDAVELFDASTALVTFLVTILTGKDDALVARIMAKVATMPEVIKNNDGTITLV